MSVTTYHTSVATVDQDTLDVSTGTGVYRVQRQQADLMGPFRWQVTVSHLDSVYPQGPPTVTADRDLTLRSWRSGTGSLTPSHVEALAQALVAWQEADA
jgi:hypothetical protein